MINKENRGTQGKQEMNSTAQNIQGQQPTMNYKHGTINATKVLIRHGEKVTM